MTDFNFKFCCISSMMPLHFEKQKQDVYFLKGRKLDGVLLDFTQLFSSYTKYKNDLTIDSKYNCIYHCYKHRFPDVFGIIKINI